MAEVQILARIRKLLEGLDAEPLGANAAELTLNQQLELLMASGAAPYQENVRMGRAFWIGTTTAVAAVVAIPTTAVLLAIYNNAADGGKSLVIDWVAAQNVVSTAVATQAQLLGLLGQVREVSPTAAAITIKKRNGLGGASSPDSAVVPIIGGTALPAGTGVAANWFPLGQGASKPGVAATPGYGLYQRVDGDNIVAPGRYFAMHVIASVVGETFQGFIGWHEKQLALG